MKFNRNLLLGLCLFGTMSNVSAGVIQYTLPSDVQGIKNEVISLNGDWKFQFSKKDKWEKVVVPGELAMQGFGIQHDKPVLYKKTFSVPSDYNNNKIILRFDGVYSYARLWINGKQAAEHCGGFTRWETDITDLVKVGKKNEIQLEVTDELNNISYASGYAHHPIGGILRDVTLYAVPKANMQNFFVETLLDEEYKNADLRVSYSMPEEGKVSFVLKDKKNGTVKFWSEKISSKTGENEHLFNITSPVLWDAEHPNLYTLDVEVESQSGNYTFTREIGFRKIEIKGDRMFVNGKQVKLRGACRHDIHPTLGRSTNNELDSLDAALFKKSNMNFVRTSHYPPSENFLKHCDRMGIYVECETAVCFVDTYRQKNYAPGKSQDDPAFTEKYLGQLQEMVATARSHSSVLFWSIGNESVYGKNFQLSYDWLKAEDKTRPVIFSYPGIVEKGKTAYDILSMHYPGCDGTLSQFSVSTRGFQGEGKPALFDEWAHVPCYTYSTLQDDPNIRGFWAISLDKMWSNLFKAPGGLGGAIWCYSDETFMLPVPEKGTPYWIEFAYTKKPKDFNGNCVGYGEWGIVDVWRREKPEFWGTKKAYSPVRVINTSVDNFVSGGKIMLPVYNRFDHTNFNELTIKVTYNGNVSVISSPDIAPHEKGIIVIPADNWCEGNSFMIEFFGRDGGLIDAEKISLGNQTVKQFCNKHNGSSLKIDDTSSDYVTVQGEGFEIPFNKSTGLMENVKSNGNVVIEKGPFLNLDLNFNHLTGAEVRDKARNYIVKDTDWKKSSFTLNNDGKNVKVALAGSYEDIKINIEIIIEPSGEMTIQYLTDGEYNGWLRESGLKFHLADNFSNLSWKRKGYWSYYPEGNFAGNEGNTPLYNPKKVNYGENPEQDWNMDTYNYYYFSDKGALCNNPLTNKAKGMKENIYEYILTSDKASHLLGVTSAGGDLGCRMNKTPEDKLILYVDNRWDYPEIAWGDYCKELEVIPVSGTVKLHL